MVGYDNDIGLVPLLVVFQDFEHAAEVLICVSDSSQTLLRARTSPMLRRIRFVHP